MAYFNFLRPTVIGQSSEAFTEAIAQNDTNIAKYSLLMLTTNEKVNLDPTLKRVGMLVYDIDLGEWFTWSLVSGTYQWKPKIFEDSYFNYAIKKREYKVTFSTDVTGVNYYSQIGAYYPANEIMIVTLDGNVLTEGIHYTVNASISRIESTGVWYANQDFTITIIYTDRDDENTDLSSILSRLSSLETQTNTMENNLVALDTKVNNKVIIRQW